MKNIRITRHNRKREHPGGHPAVPEGLFFMINSFKGFKS
jgi:hypothetical protein